MKHSVWLLAIAAATPAIALAQPLVLSPVTLIDVREGTANPGMTVVITGNRITDVGSVDEVDVPDGATIVDGTGRYLIPGLWDMHTHNTWNSFNLFIANGITGVREMGLSTLPLPEILALRRKVRDGEVIGPRFVAAGPTVDGVPSSHMARVSVMTPEQGRSAVDSLAAAGADFIKVYDLDRETFFAIAEAAAERGIPIDGHLSPRVTLEEAAAAGQRSVEHYTRSHSLGLLALCSSRPDEVAEALDALNALDALPRDAIHLEHRRRFMKMMVDSYDEERCRSELARLGEYKTWHTPTLTMGMGRRDIFDDDVMQDPRFKYVTPQRRAAFQKLRSIYTSSFSEREVNDFQHVIDRIIVNLSHANVGLLAGSDAFDGHGFALHGELGSLVAAGLTPVEALRTATINPTRFLGREDDLGTVEAGKLADLVLLEANPLEDISNTRKIRAVVANGRYFDRSGLDGLLAQAEAAAGAPPKPNPALQVQPSGDDLEAAVRAEIEERHRQEQKAFVEGDCDKVVSFYSDEATFYANGRHIDSLQAVRAFCSRIPRPFTREGRPPEISDNFYVLSENVASFVRTIDFEPADEDSAAFKREVITKVWQKMNDEWKIVHFHSSVHSVSKE